MYAGGSQVYRSTDGGGNWENLTAHAERSILGGRVVDIAASPREPGEVTVATVDGIWRSLDAGMSWAGLNDGLVNFPAARILALPASTRGLRVASGDAAFEWVPGERKAWREVRDAEFAADLARRELLTARFGIEITATAVSGTQMYAGAADGRIWASSDSGATWQPFKLREMGAIQRIVVDPSDARIALAAVGTRPSDLGAARSGAHILRTINGGGFWDDLTANLADVAAYGVAFERSSGAIYVATAKGLFMTVGDLNGLGPATAWRAVEGGEAWRDVAVLDVRLSAGGHHLYAVAQARGVFTALAPHRRDNPRLVNPTDLETAAAAAPGSLLTLAGREIRNAQLGSGAPAPVLASTPERSEIQVPFDAQGDSVQFQFDAGLRFGLPLQQAVPSIFIDRDGAPMLLDATTGVMLDGMTAARPGSRIQVLMSGLGRVKPDWPAGVPAPSEAPPEVVAKVRAVLGGSPVEVSRAVLAPGYVGFYLVEIEIPPIVNYGPTELLIEAAGRESNRVRIVIEP
ncbi:hypothetical protein F183_A52400 [Bryobacterales bacterium F-183]|nr:hypothetical protein F183_A52400 [Bryobacterales bacterium F-183]